MENIIGIVNFVKDHLQDIILIITSSVTVASVIVRLTPTLKDDAILLPIVKFIGKYIALNTNAPAQKERNSL